MTPAERIDVKDNDGKDLRRIERVLIANRGEIASRVARACRRLGLSPVGVFSDADAEMPFVRNLDAAVRLPGRRPSETYLRIESLIEAGRRLGVDAIHPGYGFLAERAELARACRDAGWVFVGPSAEVIESMASKRRARDLVQSLGLPMIPGWHGDDDEARLVAEARRIGLPVLLKASAGGGGKGMRVVHDEAALHEAIASCRREAASAFGDGSLLIEAYLDAPRHIEVQILGDAYGDVVHLYERECSVQRRHQKVIEETPAPNLDAELRRRLCDASVAIGKALRYEGAGTVEWLVGHRAAAGPSSFYFLEVNTRLQVEHAITEEVVGLDLAVAQLRIARGERLPVLQHTVVAQGHAIEARLYAEDPSSGGLPQTGTLLDWHLPAADGLRVEAGVEAGTHIGPDYDPMLAKIIAYGDSREVALGRLRGALRSLSVGGLVTNRELLIDLLGTAQLIEGQVDTAFLEAKLQTWVPTISATWVERAAVVATLWGCCERSEARAVLRAVPPGWRGVGASFAPPERIRYRLPDGERLVVEYRMLAARRWALRVEWPSRSEEHAQGGDEGARWVPSTSVELVSVGRASLCFEQEGLRIQMRVVRKDECVFVHHPEMALLLHEEPRFSEPVDEMEETGCVAPMAGTVVAMHVEEGQRVEAGDLLCVIEAMKMEHPLRAAQAATIEAIRVSLGASVQRGEALIAFS